MASNDTNSWDDDAHELMRQRWQQAFSEHRIQARPALSRRIFGSLKAERWRRRVYRVALVGLLLLLPGTGLVYQRYFEDSMDAGLSNSTSIPAARQSSTSSSFPPAASNKRNDLPVPHIRKQQLITTQEQSVSSSTTPKGAEKVRITSGVVGLLPTSLPYSGRGEGSIKSSIEDRTIQDEATTIQKEPLVDDHFAIAPRMIDPPQAGSVVWKQLPPLGIMPLSVALKLQPDQLLDFKGITQHSASPVVARRRWRWFAEVMPTSSFQWMTAPPTSGTYLSAVEAPAAFSSATWGYQLAGGIRWQRWQAHLSIGHLRRWAYYTVNKNNYRVESSPNNSHQLVRETYAVTENKLLPLVGVGLSQRQLLLRGRYVAELGGQVSYLPTIGQALIGLRGGLDRRLVIGQRSELQMGLRVEYGLNQLQSEQRHLSIHPLVVGIGLRIQPRIDQ